MEMPLYEDSLGPMAKRPRVDYNTNNIDGVGHPILVQPQLVEIQMAKKSSEGE